MPGSPHLSVVRCGVIGQGTDSVRVTAKLPGRLFAAGDPQLVLPTAVTVPPPPMFVVTLIEADVGGNVLFVQPAGSVHVNDLTLKSVVSLFHQNGQFKDAIYVTTF